MPKSQRLMELLLEVNRLRRFTVGQLADSFGVSKRTILRDLRELETIGVPLYSEVGPHGGFRILNERLLPPIAFTEEEAAAMFFAYQSLQQLGELPFETETKAALAKFYSYMPADTKLRIESMRQRMQFYIPKRPMGSPHLKLLLSASIKRQPLEIEYDSLEGAHSRTVLPAGIYADNGFWYCPAYCYLRGDYRLFRADRILEARLVEAPAPAATAAANADVHLGNWQKQASRKHLTALLEVRLTKEGVRRSHSEAWMADGLRIEEDGSGSYSGFIPIHDLAYFANLFLSIGTDALVSRPPELLEEMRVRIRNLGARYLNQDTVAER